MAGAGQGRDEPAVGVSAVTNSSGGSEAADSGAGGLPLAGGMSDRGDDREALALVPSAASAANVRGAAVPVCVTSAVRSARRHSGSRETRPT